MYTPHHFKNNNIVEVLDFVQNNSFGIIVSQHNAKLVATHFPLQLHKNEEGKYVLQGHLSRANPQGKFFENGVEVLAIFNGPNSYISSSWYNHENVPTWNYIAVHIYGTIKIIEGDKVIQALTQLVDKYEQKSEHPVSVTNMSTEYLASQLKGIIAFEIEITDVQSAYKLSQNRDNVNHENIVKELRKSGDENSNAIADAMEASLPSKRGF
jgi:transcriptional regulator